MCVCVCKQSLNVLTGAVLSYLQLAYFLAEQYEMHRADKLVALQAAVVSRQRDRIIAEDSLKAW